MSLKITFHFIWLSVVHLNAVTLNVVAPPSPSSFQRRNLERVHHFVPLSREPRHDPVFIFAGLTSRLEAKKNFFHPLHFVTQKAENGATTLAITTFSKMALRIQSSAFSVIVSNVLYAECHIFNCNVQ
jgi:hypothetical protein